MLELPTPASDASAAYRAKARGKHWPTPLGRIMVAWDIRLVDLAYASGCSLGLVREFCQGKLPKPMTQLATMQRIAAALGVSPAELWPDQLTTAPPSGGLIDRERQRRAHVNRSRAQLKRRGRSTE